MGGNLCETLNFEKESEKIKQGFLEKYNNLAVINLRLLHTKKAVKIFGVIQVLCFLRLKIRVLCWILKDYKTSFLRF